MTEERIPTTRRLADALRQASAPASMIRAAEAGDYDEYKSQSAAPILDLVHECQMQGLHDLARRARFGEFDAEKWEAEEWAKSPDGQLTFLEFFGQPSPPRQGSAKLKFRQPKHRH